MTVGRPRTRPFEQGDRVRVNTSFDDKRYVGLTGTVLGTGYDGQAKVPYLVVDLKTDAVKVPVKWHEDYFSLVAKSRNKPGK